MYQAEYLSTYPFFRQTLEGVSLASVHDSLTGLISRKYMLEFVHDLIRRQMPFTLAIIDLDNFKSINDNYGHATGDGVLSQVGRALRECVGRDGVAGRFGGDEFLMVYFKCSDYAHIHDLYSRFYSGSCLFRRSYDVDGLNLFITGTVGSAAYPENARDFDTLFALVDKTLYRGKTKGRNCYIIYVEAKHAHLEIPTLARRSLYDTLRRMDEAFARGGSAEEKLVRAFAPIQENLHLTALMLIDPWGTLWNVTAGQSLGVTGGVDSLMENGLYSPIDLKECMDVNPPLANALVKAGFESALFYRVEGRGCLVLCPEPHTMHLWQDEEYCAAFFLGRLFSAA